MIRYGEIFLKSEPVKRRFISMMVKNIGLTLEAEGLSHRIEAPRGRILIFGDEPGRIAEVAARTFGVVGASICTVTTADIPGSLLLLKNAQNAASCLESRLQSGRVGQVLRVFPAKNSRLRSARPS